MNDFLNKDDGYDWYIDDSSGVIDLVGTCGAITVSQNIRSTLARAVDCDLLSNENITLATRRQILRQSIISIDGVSDVDLSGFNPSLSDDSNCRTGYSFGSICPTIDCDNSVSCSISF